MSRWYRALYRVGFTPWEVDAEALRPQIEALLGVEESTRSAPYGRALDLGCGTGRWSVGLARRGWDVVGVDVVPRAIAAARWRAEDAGVEVAPATLTGGSPPAFGRPVDLVVAVREGDPV